MEVRQPKVSVAVPNVAFHFKRKTARVIKKQLDAKKISGDCNHSPEFRLLLKNLEDFLDKVCILENLEPCFLGVQISVEVQKSHTVS